MRGSEDVYKQAVRKKDALAKHIEILQQVRIERQLAGELNGIEAAAFEELLTELQCDLEASTKRCAALAAQIEERK